VTRLLLVRHAEPLRDRETLAAEWPLTEKGEADACVLGTELAGRSAGAIVWTSPERRARETAALLFPLVAARVSRQLSEVTKPWYASADDLTKAVATYLRGDAVEGWEHRQAVIARITELKLSFRSLERLVLVSHGLFLTTWLDHELTMNDPLSFWSGLRMPDAWELNLEEKSFARIL
jgi:broad specificity phosphatase PhoE